MHFHFLHIISFRRIMESNCGGTFEALKGNVYGNTSSNQTLILGHGFGTTQSVWQNIIPFLAYVFNIKLVVYDLAFSPDVCPRMYQPKKYSNYSGYADDLVDVLDQLNVEGAIYLGHSMSAMIGCLAALRRPHRFKHLILLAASPRYLNDKHYHGGFSKHDVETLFKDISKNYTRWVQSFARKAIGVNDSIAIARFEESLLRMNSHVTLDVAKAAFLSDWRSILPQLHIPTTIIQSRADFAVPKKVAYFMKKHLGGHPELKILETEGHLPQLTAPLLLFRLLTPVLTKIINADV